MLPKLLVRFLRPFRLLLLLVLIFQAAQALLALALPSLNAEIIDQGVAKGDTGFILRTGAEMLGLTLLQAACSITAVYFGARTAMGFGRDVRGAVFAQVGRFSEREVQQFGPPSLITRSTNDVQQVQMLVLMTCTLLVATPITGIGGVVFAIRQNAPLSWIVVVAVPVLLVSVGLVISRMVPWFRRMQTRIDTVNRVLREQLTGIRVIRAFVREQAEMDRFADANAAVTDTAMRAGRLFALMFPIVMLILNAASVAVLWFGAGLIDGGSLQIGSLTAFLTYLVQILMAVMMATFMAVLLPRAAVSADRIGEVLDTRPSVVSPTAPRLPAGPPSGEVEFRHATFQYPGAEHPVLRDVSFVARPGETTAIIGSTGAGKTTLVNLVPRLFDVTGGQVLVDGVDVREYEPEALFARIGLVPQRAYLFSGTVASNLRYGDPEADDEALWAALRTAQADFVATMPDGLETPIAQGGTDVSGGQRQRLAIARALLAKPGVLVFDDAFSALDTATDARLRAALAREAREATVLVVAQRVATILEADRIVVLDDGVVVAVGTHEELLASSPEYAEIVASQLPDERRETAGARS